jgi:SAM-dependent methyltransferase
MNARKNLFKFYWAVQKVIVPTLKFSQTLYEEVLKNYVTPDTRWLDLGCGHQLLPTWREEQERLLVKNCRMVVGIDYDLPSLVDHKSIDMKVRGTITRLPFREEFFDLVTANMVVEHLDDPEVQFREVNRALKPGGLFIFHTPNALGYTTIGGRIVPDGFKDKLIYLLDGRKENDVFETHYKANTQKRISEVADATGFEVVKIKMVVSDAGFALVPPLAIPELIWIRILMTKMFKPLRTNIIAILRKRET